jgi:predicted site-specific integrase-resolvase
MSGENPENKFWSYKEVSNRYLVSVKTIRHWIKLGYFNIVRVGITKRISESSLLEFESTHKR